MSGFFSSQELQALLSSFSTLQDTLFNTKSGLTHYWHHIILGQNPSLDYHLITFIQSQVGTFSSEHIERLREYVLDVLSESYGTACSLVSALFPDFQESNDYRQLSFVDALDKFLGQTDVNTIKNHIVARWNTFLDLLGNYETDRRVGVEEAINISYFDDDDLRLNLLLQSELLYFFAAIFDYSENEDPFLSGGDLTQWQCLGMDKEGLLNRFSLHWKMVWVDPPLEFNMTPEQQKSFNSLWMSMTEVPFSFSENLSFTTPTLAIIRDMERRDQDKISELESSGKESFSYLRVPTLERIQKTVRSEVFELITNEQTRLGDLYLYFLGQTVESQKRIDSFPIFRVIFEIFAMKHLF